MYDDNKRKRSDLFCGCGNLLEEYNRIIETSAESSNSEICRKLLSTIYNSENNIEESNPSIPPINFYINCNFKKCNIT